MSEKGRQELKELLQRKKKGVQSRGRSVSKGSERYDGPRRPADWPRTVG